MSSPNEPYQDLILRHHRQPKHYGKLDPADLYAKGLNPLCGDEIEVFAQKQQQTLQEITFLANACSIAKASASLMTVMLKGQSYEDAARITEQFNNALTAKDFVLPENEFWQEVRIFLGVKQYPARIRCALLAWITLAKAMGESP
ncbi:MAG: Fe-S cluster assembly sulfur transfer protein SufU [Spirochaetota bacterium]